MTQGPAMNPFQGNVSPFSGTICEILFTFSFLSSCYPPPINPCNSVPPFHYNKAHESISAHQRSLVQPPVTADGLTPRPLPPLHPAGPLTTMRLTSQGGHMVCSMCGRTNAPDIRFCDWCGSRVSVVVVLSFLFFNKWILYTPLASPMFQLCPYPVSPA